MAIHDEIARYMEGRGVKQVWLAEAAGMSCPNLSMKLSGTRRLYADEYERICDALGVPYDLFFNRDKKTREDAGEW